MAGESQQVMKNMSRLKNPKKRIDGYDVRIQWNKKSYSKLFQLKDDDSTAHAWQQATAWRDMKEAEIGKPRTERVICGIRPYTRRTNTGEKGIQCVMKQHHKGGKRVGKRHPYYIVTTFNRTGKMRRTGISIEKHGEENAMKLARQRYHELKNSSWHPRKREGRSTEQGHNVNFFINEING
jgi:hypothetical protein